MTLRMKLILGFSMITIPLVCFLIYTNYYSSQVVREQVANYNSGLLTLYGDQIDQTLENYNSYLYKQANQEPIV
ncbi:MAG: two-component sensor histidine kinase, partial [Gorillibacterium sp.]|nr:two-component sensor histidine kinase [Gorillibacterium sp.]